MTDLLIVVLIGVLLAVALHVVLRLWAKGDFE